MQKDIVLKKEKASISAPLLFQLIASLSWIASVIVYGSFQLGDWLQLVAASAWTISNIMYYFTD